MMLVAAWTASTDAPGTAAPLSSTTRPLMLPTSTVCCAAAGRASVSASANANRKLTRENINSSPKSSQQKWNQARQSRALIAESWLLVFGRRSVGEGESVEQGRRRRNECGSRVEDRRGRDRFVDCAHEHEQSEELGAGTIARVGDRA